MNATTEDATSATITTEGIAAVVEMATGLGDVSILVKSASKCWRPTLGSWNVKQKGCGNG